ncbi:MAG: iron(III) transport system permease protein [Lysobacterales bacterium]|jgi:iron(III) transport system permease protein
MIIPLGFVVGSAFGVDAAVWQKLLARRIPQLMLNSTLLVTFVCLASVILGGGLAFLVERTTLPFKNFFRTLLIAPLITPCYIIGICYINFVGKNGLAEKWLSGIGLDITVPSFYGFWGASFILVLGIFPYVFTLVSSAMHTFDPRFSDSAKCLGLNAWQRLIHVSIPMLIPALSASVILVGLYVLSDFGVVSMLRYPTFVSVIYEQIASRYDFQSAAALSTVLVMFTLVFFLGQEVLTYRKEFSSLKIKVFNQKKYVLGAWLAPTIILISLIVIFSLVVPITVLIYWFIKSTHLASETQVWVTPFKEILRSGLNSLSISALVATVAVVLALPIAYLRVRTPNSKFTRVLTWMAQSGLALPGVLVALGVSLVITKTIPSLTYSIFALFFAFLIHFFAQTYQTMFAGLTQISKQFEESGRMLGCSSFQTFWHITRPLLLPSIMTSWILIFLSAMRELPASLLLRPAGFDPLTVKVWIAASEGFYELAALPALCVIILSLPMVILVSKGSGRSTYELS